MGIGTSVFFVLQHGRVRQASESGTIKPTRCAGVVDVRLTTSRSHVVLNVATPTSVSATTTGPLKPRGGRPPTGRMKHLKIVQVKFRNGFREGPRRVPRVAANKPAST